MIYGTVKCVKVEMQHLAELCCNVLCNTQSLETIPLKICLSSLCSKYFLFLLLHLGQNVQQWGWGGLQLHRCRSQSLLLFWQLLTSTLCRSQVTGSTTPLFGRQMPKKRPLRYLSSLQVYTHKIKNDLNALSNGSPYRKFKAFVFFYCF